MESYPTSSFDNSRAVFERVVTKLAGPAAEALDHERLGDLIEAEGREVLRRLYQDQLDLWTAREQRKPVVGVDGEKRTEAQATQRNIGTRFGSVTLTRLALSRHGVSGALRPLDARLNLPPGKHSRGIARRVAWGVAQSSY